MTTALLAMLLASPSLPLMLTTMPQDNEVTAPPRMAEVKKVSLHWQRPVTLHLEGGPYELVLRFDQPVSEAALRRFAAEAGANLADLRWNDASLVMRPASGRRLEAVASGRVLTVRFLADAENMVDQTGSSGAALEGSAQDLEWAIARAEADAAAGYPELARRRLAPLSRRYPEDKRISRLLADADVAEGSVLLGASRYREIAADDPFARRTMAEAGGNLTAAATLRGGKAFSQAEAGLNALVTISPSLALGAGLRYTRSKAVNVYEEAGIAHDVVAHSIIADLLGTLQLARTTRLELQASAQLDEKVMGGGARLFAGPPERQARLVLAYRLPDIATPEQSVLGGHFSRAGLGGTLRLTPELTVQADGSWNQYGLRGRGSATRSIAVSAGLDYVMRRGSPSLALSYRLDAEYVGRTELRPNGLAFIPLSDRENHSFQLIAGKSWTNWQLTAGGGWTFDRLGNTDGPTANVSLTGRLNERWRLQTSGGVSSISRPGISGRQLYLRVAITRYLGRF